MLRATADRGGGGSSCPGARRRCSRRGKLETGGGATPADNRIVTGSPFGRPAAVSGRCRVRTTASDLGAPRKELVPPQPAAALPRPEEWRTCEPARQAPPWSVLAAARWTLVVAALIHVLLGRCAVAERVKNTVTPFDIEIDSFFYFPDSKVIALHDVDGILWRSGDEGKSWENLSGKLGKVVVIVPHDFEKSTTFFYLDDGTLSRTKDRGLTFQTVGLPTPPNKMGLSLMDFHPDEAEWLLFLGGTSCPDVTSGKGCHTVASFSRDGGQSWDEVETWADKCIFGKDAKYKSTLKETVFCTVWRKKDSSIGQDVLKQNNPDPDNWRQLVRTDDFGRTREILLDHVLEFFMFENFLAVATERGGDLRLMISLDGKNFAEAIFPPTLNIHKHGLTVLQSTTGIVFLDVFQPSGGQQQIGSLFVSNGNGTYFTLSLANTNRNEQSADFEKAQGIEGVIFANRVANPDELAMGARQKKLETMISYDDGGHWRKLNGPDCSGGEDCRLHLHGKTDITRPGVIYSVASAPGLFIGAGNVGRYMTSYTESNTYLSRDAGNTWTKIRDGESHWGIGDSGGILVVVDDEAPTTEVRYSTDYGRNWIPFKFSEQPVRVALIAIEPTWRSTSFLILGKLLPPDTSDARTVVVHLDFSGVFDRKCEGDLSTVASTSADFEKWHPTASQCQMGHEVVFWRRKQDSACFVGEKLVNVKVERKNCECTKDDFECDVGFWRDSEGNCKLYGPDPSRPANCNPGSTYMGSSGYRKEAMNTCEGGEDLAKPVQRTCVGGEGVSTSVVEKNGKVVDYYYFRKSQVLMLHMSDLQVHWSDTEGGSWKPLLPAQEIVDVILSPYKDEIAYFISAGSTGYVTKDRGVTLSEIRFPMEPNKLQIPVLQLHPEEEDWLIFTGSSGCNSLNAECFSQSYITRDGGGKWEPLSRYTKMCIFGRDAKFRNSARSLIFCERYKFMSGNQKQFSDNPVQLLRTEDFFKTTGTLFESVIGFAVFDEFMVVAEQYGNKLRLQVSVDGENFAMGQFPKDINTNNAYTVLESITHSVLLHVKNDARRDAWGTICKSNGNGTYFSSSLAYVNGDARGYVDFEKMQGFPGVALANVVTNAERASVGGTKKISTRITFNAGGSWKPLKAPSVDSHNVEYSCKGCPLNLHSYTERRDPRDMFSSSSAVGLMMGVGNVGETLKDYEDSDTFLTRNAGVDWTEVRKGAYMHDIGDHGGILLLVDDEQKTDHAVYSIDEGKSWREVRFSEEKMAIKDIITEPHGTSRRFVLLGAKGDKTAIVYLDFTGATTSDGKPQPKCVLNEDIHSPNDDFEPWTPSDPDSNCLFGHTVTYYRRMPAKECYIGDSLDNRKVVEQRNCSCTREDFECDFNFRPDGSGNCVLVDGEQPVQTSCLAKSTASYTVSTGYRKIKMSTCEGGLELDKGEVHSCPGHGGLSAGGWAAIILVPACAVGAFLCFHKYRNSYGRLRLPNSIPRDVPMPAFLANFVERLRSPSRRGSRYSRLATDEQPIDVLMDDYDSPDIL